MRVSHSFTVHGADSARPGRETGRLLVVGIVVIIVSLSLLVLLLRAVWALAVVCAVFSAMGRGHHDSLRALECCQAMIAVSDWPWSFHA